MAHDTAERLALWRYHLIAEALGPRIRSPERGLIVRRIAAEEHTGPDGEPRAVSRTTLDRWIRAYRQHGLASLHDRRRSDKGTIRHHPDLLEEAIRLRCERPLRSAAHIAEMLFARHGVRIPERTLREQLAKRGLARAELLRDGRTFGRYEAAAPDERWIGDVLVGPFVPYPRAPGSVRARLFLIVDDHSRLVIHGRWVGNETLRGTGGAPCRHPAARPARAALRRRRGRLCRSGTRPQLWGAGHPPHPQPALCPQGRGKQERPDRVIRERFLLEATQVGIARLDELNDRFTAWVERYCNVRVHSGTGESPAARHAKGSVRQADPELLRAAFLWSAQRRVSRSGTVSFEGNEYEADAVLRGRRVDLRYRPEDLTTIEVWSEGRQHGHLVPLVIGRHVHRMAPPPPRPTPEPSGIDHLGGVLAEHEAETTGSIAFRELPPREEDES